MNRLTALSVALPALLAGCVAMPTGPSVMVLPGTGRSFDQFRADDYACRQYSQSQIGGQTAAGAQQDAAVKSAVVGTAIGAAAGAALGGHGSDAAVGAGVGLLTGSMIGASTGNLSGYEAQRRYDIAFTQCMYAKGHRVPVSRGYTAPPRYAAPPAYNAPPVYNTPPPPPPSGTPPPPPGSYAPPS